MLKVFSACALTRNWSSTYMYTNQKFEPNGQAFRYM